MAGNGGYPNGKAAALVAYAIDVESLKALDHQRLNLLVDEVCGDDTERARLVSFVSASQNPQLPAVILELLGTRLDRLRNALEAIDDTDAVYGVWAQRTAGGAILASIGFVVAGALTGGWSVLAVGCSIAAGGGTSYGRAVLKKRGRAARRAVEQTLRLIESVERTLPKAK